MHLRLARPVVVFAIALAAQHVPAHCTTPWLPDDGYPGVNGRVAATLFWDPEGAGPRLADPGGAVAPDR